MSESDIWDEAEKAMLEQYGPYPHAQPANSLFIAVGGLFASYAVLPFFYHGDFGAPAGLIALLMGGGHYAIGALGRWFYGHRLAKTVEAIKSRNKAIAEALDPYNRG